MLHIANSRSDTMNIKSCFAPVLLATVLITGCSTTIVSPDKYSGFLVDYSNLKEEKTPSGVSVMRWIEPGVDAGKFTSVYFQPSVFYPLPKGTEKIPQSTLDGITQYYDQALQREFGKVLKVARTPGPGTLIVKPAITAISAKTQSLHAYEVIPIALLAAGISTATGIRDQDTTLATEAMFIDASDNHLVAQVVRQGTGKPLENSSQVMKANDAKALLDGWASDMAKSYQSLKAK